MLRTQFVKSFYRDEQPRFEKVIVFTAFMSHMFPCLLERESVQKPSIANSRDKSSNRGGYLALFGSFCILETGICCVHWRHPYIRRALLNRTMAYKYMDLPVMMKSYEEYEITEFTESSASITETLFRHSTSGKRIRYEHDF